MDRVLPKKSKLIHYWKFALVIILLLLLLLILRIFLFDSFNSISVKKENIEFYTLQNKNFEASFSTDGKVIPLQSYQVETPEGGKIEKVLKKIGDYVNKGDIIAVLSNDDLQMQLINSETEVANQINNLSTAKIQRNQSHLSQKRNLFSLKQQLNKKQREINHLKTMREKNFVSEEEYQTQFEDYETLKNNYELSAEEAKIDSLMREQQVIQIEQSLSQVRKNLVQMKNKVTNLTITAPINGQITDIVQSYGKILSAGSQIALIENNKQFYIQAKINQYYLKHLKKGAKAKLTDFNPEIIIEIENIHPKLEGDNVTVDFIGVLPDNVKSGQVVNIDLLTTKSTHVLCIPLGEYLNENDYREVFVVDQSHKNAIRRPIETGRRNAQEIEVIKGLNEGDQIITSSNVNWKKKNIIKLK